MIQLNSINNWLKVYIFDNHIFVNLNFRIFIITKNFYSIKMLSCLKKLKMLVH